MTSGSKGVFYGIGAYGLWGVFPLYFRLLESSGAVEVVVHRVLWSLLVCAVVVAPVRGWPELRTTLATPRRVVPLGIGAMLLAVNWGVYIYAVESGQVVEASLGYYINPLVTVLLGVLVLRERLRPWEWSAVGAGAVGVGVRRGRDRGCRPPPRRTREAPDHRADPGPVVRSLRPHQEP